MSPLPGPAMPVAASSLFGDPAAIRCERAVAELRSGRPVVITDDTGQRMAVIALDSATARSFETFAGLADDRHYLFLTETRARVLGVEGIEAAQGVRIPLAGIPFDALPQLGYLREPGPLPPQWNPGDALDAGAVELARLGLLLPAMVGLPLAGDDARFDGAAQVALCDLAEGAAHAAHDYELVARSPVPLREVGMTTFAVFRGGVAQRDQVAIIVGEPDLAAVVPVRVHSSCLTGDLFGSLKCDCGDQLRRGLRKLKELGGGVLLYLDQEGRGTGIAAKMRAYGYQHDGLDTIDADAQLGFGADERRYGSAVAMLKGLGIARIALLSNNPTKVQRLRNAGMDVVDCIPVTGDITVENEQYLRTKAERAGHLLDVDALIQAAQ